MIELLITLLNVDAFEINSKNSDIGENITKLDASIKGEDVGLSLNYKYIIDCFQSIASDSIIIKFNGPNKPIILSGTSDQSFIYLIMPMNR